MDYKSILHFLIPLIGYGLITGIANLILSRRSQIELYAESHPKTAALQKLLRAIGLDPWQIISAISLWATSKLPDAQRSEGLKAADPKPNKNDKGPPSPPLIPISYLNEDDTPTPRPAIPPGALIVGLVAMLCVTSCSIFGSGGSFWPKVEKCAPSPASLVSQVADILIAGGDYEAALKQLALQQGGAAVICAVQAFVNSIGHKVGAAPDELSGEARGQVFLSKHPVSE